MMKEEIYERYWRKLVQIRKIYASDRIDEDNMYAYFKRLAERDRDRLLKRYGHDPFSGG